MDPRLKRRPLRSQVQEILLERVLEGELAPGENIRERELAEELGISRTPLREALLRLEHEGLVGYNQGRGFYVWPLSVDEAAQLYQIAGALESLAVRTTTALPSAIVEKLRQANDRLADAQGNPDEMIKWDTRFHQLLVQQSENREVLDLIGRIRNRLYRYRWYGYEYVALHKSREKTKSVDQHREIVERLEVEDFARAGRLVERHWDRGIEVLADWLAQSRPQHD